MPENAPDPLVLAGDIGGTKTNLGLFRQAGPRPVPEALETFPSREFACLEDIVERFLHGQSRAVAAACFGLAGPVLQGRSRTTNLPWAVSEAGLRDRFGWTHSLLLNDLAATVRGVPLLEPGETVALSQGEPAAGAPIGLVAPGTGHGQALLAFQDGRPVPLASEGGHADFAPTNETELRLWRFLRERHGHVSLERVASGPGLAAIYAFLLQDRNLEEPGWLRERLKGEDPPRVITEAALHGLHPGCAAALDLFVRILGSICGNLALTALTRGGLYLGGGIPPKILPKLREAGFLEAFCAKGRFESLLRSVPVLVITNDRTALLGAAQEALALVRSARRA